MSRQDTSDRVAAEHIESVPLTAALVVGGAVLWGL